MKRENVEDLYRLSPTQQGLLFHALNAGEAAPYFEQFVIDYGAVLDPRLLERAARRLFERHSILRTGFRWRDLDEPVQIVHRQVEPPLEHLDWSGLAEGERERRLADLLAQERARGFDLTQPPLLRLSFIRWSESSTRIVWNYHHLVLDGWSYGLLVQEMTALYEAALYEAEAQGREPSLPPSRPFRDYISWLRRQDAAAAEAYWRRTLGSFTAPTTLACDRAPGEPGELGRYAETEIELSAELSGALQALTRAHRVTLYTLVAGAWAFVLGRHAGTDDVVFGNTVSGRPATLAGSETMLGCFINTLPVRVGISPGEELVAWLKRLQADQAELRQFEHSALVDVRRWSGLAGSRQLFDTILVFESSSAIVEKTEKWQGYQRTNFPLALVAWPGRQLVLRAGYYEGHFDRVAVQRLLAHLEETLGAMANGARLVGDLPALPAADRERRAALRLPAREGAEERCLHEVFAEQAVRRGGEVAVSADGLDLTYAELERRANQLAHHLGRLGVGAETRVGLYTERSAETVVGLLGILKAGGAYLPIDPAYPAERRDFMLADSGTSVVVTQERLAGDLPAGVHAVRLDGDREALEQESEGDPRVSRGADGLAYVIYTSGSTGRPKGVLIPHRQVLRLFRSTEGWFGFGPHDVWTLFHSPAFDFSVWEIWGALLYGGRLVVVPHLVSRSPEAFHRLLREEGATVLNQTPSAFRQLIAADEAAAAEDLALRLVIFGGEALDPRTLQPWLARHGDARPRLVNMYGITETTVHVTYRPVTIADAEAGGSPIGVPIPDLSVHVADRHQLALPDGVPGEMLVGGAGLARGYLSRPELTAERFVPDPFAGAPGERLYRSGDLARVGPDGELEYLGRTDHQIKVRGFRIEPGEIEAALRQHPQVREVVVVARGEAGEDRALAAYVVLAEETPVAELRAHLRALLPEHMVPAWIVPLAALPLTAHGKVDRQALPAPDGRRAADEGSYVEPASELERTLAGIWAEVLGLDRVGARDNFFDLGGHSLKLVAVQNKLRQALGREIPVVELFQFPTVAALAERLGGEAAEPRRDPTDRTDPTDRADFAVIGMAGRFPGARDLEEFWANLRDGVESIVPLTDEELAGVDPGLLASPGYVKACPVLAGVELFDADFFGFSPREAEILDPQQRLFLECSWHALENAGYDPKGGRRPVGVYAGAQLSTYMLNLFSHPEIVQSMGIVALQAAVDKDFLATRVSYALDLKGPSLAVQTACSTSLVAVHLACQALRLGECDMALAGGVTVRVPQAGYVYQEAGIQSPDGHCRAFDAGARGTVFGSGVGVVVLKRLADALRDGDAVRAVIKGTAINNDGAVKVGYTAPGVEGQAEVIAAAQVAAGVSPGTVSYVEAHGTGTPLGDPIEVAALARAFRGGKTGSCALGTVKSNVGHLDAAAGVAGLVKTVLALEHRQIPPSLHFETPNPKIDFAATPFYVNARLADWPAGEGPRRAGVSSFGIGGTNAHVVLEEAPAAEPSGASRPHQLLLLSARAPEALEQATDELASFLMEHPEISLADAAHTLRVGRHAFPHRRMLVCASAEDAAAALAARDPERVLAQRQERIRRPVAFLFPGQGAQHPGMARDLYAAEPVFRREVDAAAEQLLPRLGRDLRELLWDEPGERAASELRETRLAQPALFVVEHALARLWLSWGVKPWAMIGHSLGEYVAACLAGVFSPADALELVAARGELMQSLPPGAMLAVDLPESEVAARLANHPELSLAAVNGPSRCVVSGPEGAIEVFAGRRLHTSHAFHSAMMEPILADFRQRVAKVELRPPSIPYLSNLTGGWIAPGEATDPGYWARHLRATVRFGDGMDRLLAGAAENGAALLEVGPGRTLAELARQAGRGAGRPSPAILSSLRHPKDPQPDTAALLQAAGRLWLAGAAIDWEAFCAEEMRRRVPLPDYPFQRRRFWIEAARPARPAQAPAGAPAEQVPASHSRPELAATPFAAPRDEAERRLVSIWQELLGIAAPGIHDDFFELGGHSLLATRLVSRVRQAFGVELPLEAVFEAPTVARLAARITTASIIEAPPIVPVPRDGELPLSYAQQRLLFLDVLAHGDTAYNLPLGLRLSGPLYPGALAGALAGLVARHEVLRTTFRIAGGRAWQVVSPEAPAPDLPLIDLSGLSADEAEAQARRIAAEDAGRRIDLFAGPVLRATLLRLAAAEHALVITVHHVAGDGWSWGILLREIVELYESALEGRAPRLPALAVQYADFAAWQRRWLAGEVLDRQIDYWRGRLAGLPVVELPPDRPRPAVRSGRGDVEPVAVPGELTAALGRLGRQEEATLFMVLVSAFSVLLHYYEGSGAAGSDVVLGADVANRNRGETEGILGLFVNQLVLRNDLSGDPSFRELLGRVRRTTLDAYAHQDAPFDKLVEVLNPARDMSRTPLFQVKLVLQNTPLEARAVRGLSVSLFEFHNQTAKFDLLLNLTEGRAGLTGSLEYSTDLYEPATIRRLLANFAALLAAVAERPDGRLSEIEAALRESDREAWQRRSQERREQRRGAVERVRRKAIAVH